MITRRTLIAMAAAAAAAAKFPGLLTADAMAQGADATGFIQRLGEQLVAIVDGPASAEAKRQQLEPVIAESVDTDAIAQFCLGRFARTASPAQLADFHQLFRQVLVANITGKLGDFRGVTFRMTSTSDREGDSYVGTSIQRPNQQPANVQWVVSHATGRPKIVDLIAEGTSLRQTQRSDYASYLSSHGNDLNALLAALKRQAGA